MSVESEVRGSPMGPATSLARARALLAFAARHGRVTVIRPITVGDRRLDSSIVTRGALVDAEGRRLGRFVFSSSSIVCVDDAGDTVLVLDAFGRLDGHCVLEHPVHRGDAWSSFLAASLQVHKTNPSARVPPPHTTAPATTNTPSTSAPSTSPPTTPALSMPASSTSTTTTTIRASPMPATTAPAPVAPGSLEFDDDDDRFALGTRGPRWPIAALAVAATAVAVVIALQKGAPEQDEAPAAVEVEPVASAPPPPPPPPAPPPSSLTTSPPAAAPPTRVPAGVGSGVVDKRSPPAPASGASSGSPGPYGAASDASLKFSKVLSRGGVVPALTPGAVAALSGVRPTEPRVSPPVDDDDETTAQQAPVPIDRFAAKRPVETLAAPISDCIASAANAGTQIPVQIFVIARLPATGGATVSLEPPELGGTALERCVRRALGPTPWGLGPRAPTRVTIPIRYRSSPQGITVNERQVLVESK